MKLSENITGGETVGMRERLACRVILLITAAALYIDMDLFSIGSVVISVHKLAGLAGFPLALIVMGWRKLIIDLRIVLFGLLMLITFNLFYVVEGVYDGRFYSAFLQIGLNGVIAVFLMTALKRDDRSFPFFMYLQFWCSFSGICQGKRESQKRWRQPPGCGSPGCSRIRTTRLRRFSSGRQPCLP